MYVLYRRKKLIKGDLSENQQATNRLLDYYLERSDQGEELSMFVLCVNSDQAESIVVAVSAMYYSTVQQFTLFLN